MASTVGLRLPSSFIAVTMTLIDRSGTACVAFSSLGSGTVSGIACKAQILLPAAEPRRELLAVDELPRQLRERRLQDFELSKNGCDILVEPMHMLGDLADVHEYGLNQTHITRRFKLTDAIAGHVA